MLDHHSAETTLPIAQPGTSALDLLRLMRPAHWVKNAFIFAPLVFGKALFDLDRSFLAVLTFAAFCLVSSVVYILNDIADRKADAEHPKKRFRPIASGRVSVTAATIQLGVVLLAASAIGLFLPWEAVACIAIYLLMNLCYSFGLKHVVLVDIFIISGGFMLRVLAGAKAINVEVSEWLVICTLFLSLFLAIAKRRSEMNQEDRGDTRKVLDDYSPALVNLIMNVSVAGSIMSYTLYTVSDHAHRFFGTNKFIYTVPIVLFGIFRYLYLDEKRREAENPVAVIVRDPTLVATGLLWTTLSIVIIYWWK